MGICLVLFGFRKILLCGKFSQRFCYRAIFKVFYKWERIPKSRQQGLDEASKYLNVCRNGECQAVRLAISGVPITF